MMTNQLLRRYERLAKHEIMKNHFAWWDKLVSPESISILV